MRVHARRTRRTATRPPKPGEVRNDRAYLATLTCRLALAWRRSERSRKRRERVAGANGNDELDEKSLDKAHDAFSTLFSLSDKLRLPFCLHYLGGFDLGEVARRLFEVQATVPVPAPSLLTCRQRMHADQDS